MAALDPACEEALCRLITQRTGIVLCDHQVSGMRDAVEEACAQFGYAGAKDYWRALRDQPSQSPELEFLIGRITVGESYFLRDVGQMALLRDSLLPEMIARKRQARDLSLRVWSAGCSNGQEIYSIALLLHELLPDINDWTLHLLATDINTDVLAAAMRGHYREWSFRAMPMAMVNKYFTPAGREYVINEHIRQRVQFAFLNLSEDAFPSMLTETCALDLILCRNVFIYIERNVARRVMERFGECLAPDGLLLLGPSDHVEWPAGVLDRIQVGDAAYLRKLPERTRAADEPPMAPAGAGSRQHPAEISDAALSEALKTLAPGAATAAMPRAGAGQNPLERLEELLRDGRWRDALIVIEQASNEQGVTAGLAQARAKALANLGHLDAALQACEQSLLLDPTNQHTYLLQGIVLMEQEQPRPAEAALRKALYLDHAFLEAHYQLGMLLLRLGRREAGLKCLGNALNLAGQGDPQREILNAQGMNYGRFAEILRNEIGIHTAATAPDPLATRQNHGGRTSRPSAGRLS